MRLLQVTIGSHATQVSALGTNLHAQLTAPHWGLFGANKLHKLVHRIIYDEKLNHSERILMVDSGRLWLGVTGFQILRLSTRLAARILCPQSYQVY